MAKAVVVIPFGLFLPGFNYQLTIKEISRQAGTKIDWQNKMQDLIPFFDEYNCGELTLELFQGYIETTLNVEFHNGTFKKSWNAMLGEIPADLGEKLKALKALEKCHDCKVLLISNTNELHSEKILEELRKQKVTTEEIPPLKTTWQQGLNKLELIKKVFEEQDSERKLLILGSAKHVEDAQLKAKNKKIRDAIIQFGSERHVQMLEVDPKNHIDFCTIIKNLLSNRPSCVKS